jgi:hypothetical protein
MTQAKAEPSGTETDASSMILADDSEYLEKTWVIH